jgi:hypothetical protein
MIVGHLAALRGLDATEIVGPFAIAVVCAGYATVSCARLWVARWIVPRTSEAKEEP